MERFRRHEHIEYLQHAIRQLPVKVQRLVSRAHFLTGYSPIFLGLWDTHWGSRTEDDTPIDQVSFVLADFYQQHRPASDRYTTVVLAKDDALDQDVVLHELGHVVHFQLRELLGADLMPAVVPLNDYAGTHYTEAFATAFQAFFTLRLQQLGRFGFHTREELWQQDPEAFLWFRENLNQGDKL